MLALACTLEIRPWGTALVRARRKKKKKVVILEVVILGGLVACISQLNKVEIAD